MEKEKASSDTDVFSEALRRIGGTWTYEELNVWLADPKRFAPGNRMSLAKLKLEGGTGLKSAADRADIIVLLRLPTALRRSPSDTKLCVKIRCTRNVIEYHSAFWPRFRRSEFRVRRRRG